MSKPYTARSLTGATRRVRECNKIIDGYERICCRLTKERNLMARLASDKPEFFNPIVVYEAERIRDEILRVGMSE